MKNDLLWVEKYRPKKIADVIGNEEAKATFIEWLKSKRRSKKAVLLYGPPGVGKTALVNAAANEFGFRVIEMNASDTRTEKAINKVAEPATSYVALDTFSATKAKAIFCSWTRLTASRQRGRGGVGAIIKIVEESSSRYNGGKRPRHRKTPTAKESLLADYVSSKFGYHLSLHCCRKFVKQEQLKRILKRLEKSRKTAAVTYGLR